MKETYLLKIPRRKTAFCAKGIGPWFLVYRRSWDGQWSVLGGWKRRRTALAAARRCRKWGVAKYPSQVHALKGEVAQRELFDEVPA